MINIKKTILFAIIITMFSFLFLSIPTFASDYGLTDSAKVAGLKKQVGGQSDVFGVMGLIINAILSLVGTAFFGLTLYAGLRWMTARGEQAAVDQAKNILESAAIGLVIVISAYAIVTFVFTQLAGAGDSKCAAKSGTCGPPASCVAPSVVQTGLCSGGTDNVCCVPPAAN